MALKVARIPYLSCEPFYFEMERRGVELYDMSTQCPGRSGCQG